MQRNTLLIIGLIIAVVIVASLLVGLIRIGIIPSPFSVGPTPSMHPLPSDQYAITPTPVT